MLTDIDNVISTYKDRYNRIFSRYYPSHKSTGFTERNLSVNFACAMEAVERSTFTWYEAPIGEDAHKHFDAVVFNEEKKEMFIIESKRFSYLSQKLRSIGNDLQRITDASNINMICEGLHKADNYKPYGVILADVWLETSGKRRIYDNWDESFSNHYSEKMNLTQETRRKLGGKKWYTASFKSKGEDDQWLNKYKLLVFVTEINKDYIINVD